MNTDNPLIAIIQYRPLVALPPLLSLLLTLKKLSVNFVYIGAEFPAAKEFLEANNIPYIFLPYHFEYYVPAVPPGFFRRLYIKYRRAIEFYPKRFMLHRILDGLKAKHGTVIPWFQENLSVAFAGDAVLRRFPVHITTLYELSDDVGRRWFGHHYEDSLRSAIVVSPEINRSWILQAMYNLPELPLVIANKPVMHPRTCNLPVPDNLRAVFDEIGNRPMFLYQGELHSDRKDVLTVLETIARERPNYCVVVMPGNAVAKERLGKYPNAFLLPRIVAPGHLVVTSRASVGLAFYNGTDTGLSFLNAIYCAPNKIYEYSGFGIPTLGNRIPGLEYSIGASGAGICCDINADSILAAADELIAKHDLYSEKAKRFFDGTDVAEQVRAVLDRAYARLGSNEGTES